MVVSSWWHDKVFWYFISLLDFWNKNYFLLFIDRTNYWKKLSQVETTTRLQQEQLRVLSLPFYKLDPIYRSAMSVSVQEYKLKTFLVSVATCLYLMEDHNTRKLSCKNKTLIVYLDNRLLVNMTQKWINVLIGSEIKSKFA